MPTDFRVVLLSLIVVMGIIVFGLTILLPDQSSSIKRTEYDIITIDNERFTYIDSNHKIRGVLWVDKPQFVDVHTSNRTYLVIETSINQYYRKYILYLNVSDLK